MAGLVESFVKGVKLSEVRPDLEKLDASNLLVQLFKANPTGKNQYTGAGSPAEAQDFAEQANNPQAHAEAAKWHEQAQDYHEDASQRAQDEGAMREAAKHDTAAIAHRTARLAHENADYGGDNGGGAIARDLSVKAGEASAKLGNSRLQRAQEPVFFKAFDPTLEKSNPTGKNQYTGGGGGEVPSGVPQSVHDRLGAEGFAYSGSKPMHLRNGARDGTQHNYTRGGGMQAAGGETVGVRTREGGMIGWQHLTHNEDSPGGIGFHAFGADESSLHTHLDSDKAAE